MKEPYFDNSTQTWHQPLDSMQDIARDVMLSIVRDREGKLKKLISDTVESAVLEELQALARDDLSTQQMKLIASESARRTVRDLITAGQPPSTDRP